MERKVSNARRDLGGMLADEAAEPKALPLSLLEGITGGFSDDQEIGSGGFAVVYKGILDDREVAVKRLSKAYMHEKEFHREVECLMKAKHKNIVRFLGYCADTQGNMAMYDGKLVMADVQQRLLCFEYMPKGSLDNYITDASREWGLCYRIIKEICEGLLYLHENNIVHLDLKPANILLGDNMVPKITDFGLSRCFNENQSQDITQTIAGTMGYLAPEYHERGKITRAADLYSLGVIIIEILTGQREYQAIGDVLESWSERLERSQGDIQCEQIRACYEIGIECIDTAPEKRPSTRNIIDRLHKSTQMAEAAAFISGVAAATESEGKSNTDQPRVFRSVTAQGSGAGGGEGSGEPRQETLHSMVLPHPQAGQTVGMPRLAGPAATGSSDAHSLSYDGLVKTSSKVYYSPRFMYLRVVVISAQELVLSEGGRHLAPTIAKIQLGGQIRRTRPGQLQGSTNPMWNEEFIFVLSEPFEDPLVVSVETEHGELVGRVVIPVAAPYITRNDLAESVSARWFSMAYGLTVDEAAADVTDFASKIQLRLSLETAYHVLDEPTHYSNDLSPSQKKLCKCAIGILEVGIVRACNLVAVKTNQGLLANPYCVARYGEKWVRTGTLLNTDVPHWNELHTWDVFDMSTVITVAVFDNCHFTHGSGGGKDQRLGKVRVRLAMLETSRLYTLCCPLMALTTSGLNKTGELHLTIRFTCLAWVNMLAMYGKPLLPNMHYTQQVDYLRLQAVQILATRLGRAEPPLGREVVEYMLDMDSHMFSLRRCKANFDRITSLVSVAAAVAKWFDDICKWKIPEATILVHVLFLILVFFPELILMTVLLSLFMIGMWSYPRRPWCRWGPRMDSVLSHAEQAHPDELDEELDTFPTSRPDDIVRMRYDRLRTEAEKVQTAVGDLATLAERAQSLVSCRDPRMTAIFVTLSLVASIVLFVTPFQVITAVVGLYLLRHPEFRRNQAAAKWFNFYSRLSSNDGMMLDWATPPEDSMIPPDIRALYSYCTGL